MGISRSQGRITPIRAFAVICCAMFLVEHAVAATVVVGGESGWTLGIDYKKWSADNKVQQFDDLHFKYDKTLHNVVQVSKADYDACDSSSPISTLWSGEDTIKLTDPGTYFYICGIGDHCALGLKIAVRVHS